MYKYRPTPEWEHRLVVLIEDDRRKLYLRRLITKAERNGIDPADICDRDLNVLTADELDAIWRSMWEMDG